MATLYLTHPACLEHDTGPGRPELPDRLRAVEKVVSHEMFAALTREEADDDRFVEPLAEAIGGREGYIFASDLWKLLGIEPGRQTQHDDNRVGKAMIVLGFKKIQRRLSSVVTSAYQKGHGAPRLKPRRHDRDWVFHSWDQTNSASEDEVLEPGEDPEIE